MRCRSARARVPNPPTVATVHACKAAHDAPEDACGSRKKVSLHGCCWNSPAAAGLVMSSAVEKSSFSEARRFLDYARNDRLLKRFRHGAVRNFWRTRSSGYCGKKISQMKTLFGVRSRVEIVPS